MALDKKPEILNNKELNAATVNSPTVSGTIAGDAAFSGTLSDGTIDNATVTGTDLTDGGNTFPAALTSTTATTSAEGLVELATDTEAEARSSDTVVVTPGNLATFCRINTGSYTGDGETSQGITGIGFTPKYVKIWKRETTEVNGALCWETTTDIIDDNASGLVFGVFGGGSGADASASTRIDRIISLDSDGFTVDDDAADTAPNKDGEVYNYLALG
jgi:hypothetical protein